MWTIFVILLELWLASGTIYNILRIKDYLDQRKFTKQLEVHTEELIHAYDTCIQGEPIGKEED